MLLKRVNNLCAQDKKRKENVPSGVPYRPEFCIVEIDINKEYVPSFAIIISTLITEKTLLGQLTPCAN